MKTVKGLGTVALMALSVAASWVLLAPDAVPPAAAAPAATAATAPAEGQGFSVLAWPQPAVEALQAPAATPPAATVTARQAVPQAGEQETEPMPPEEEDDTPPQ